MFGEKFVTYFFQMAKNALILSTMVGENFEIYWLHPHPIQPTWQTNRQTDVRQHKSFLPDMMSDDKTISSDIGQILPDIVRCPAVILRPVTAYFVRRYQSTSLTAVLRKSGLSIVPEISKNR